jgi:hypothetical protein
MKTYFISGHRNITEEEFRIHYEDKIFKAINEEANFVVGDCQGVDHMAQKYLKTFGIKNVKVYHMFDEPRHNVGFQTVGGFQNDVDRDFAMTEDSDEDILWVRKGSERSGTQQNIDRRKWLRDRIAKNLPHAYEDLIKRESNNFL